MSSCEKYYPGLCPLCGRWTTGLPRPCRDCCPYHRHRQHGATATPPDIEERIARLAARAARELPLFAKEVS